MRADTVSYNSKRREKSGQGTLPLRVAYCTRTAHVSEYACTHQIEVVGWLVEQHHVRLCPGDHCERDATLLAAAHRVDRLQRKLP